MRIMTTRGQASVETAVLIGAAVVALVAVAVYVQRAYQGYLYTSASGQGPQVDLRQPYTDTRTLNSFQVTEEITVTRAQPGVTVPTRMPDAPSAQGGGRPLQTDVTVTTDWDVSGQATYNAR